MGNAPNIRFAGFTDDWEQRKLDDVCKMNGRIGFRGYTEKDIISKEAGGVLTFSPTNIVENQLTIGIKNTYITRDKYEESPEIMVKNGNILFVKTGSTLGKSALVTGIEEDCTVNPQVVVIKAAEDIQKILSVALTSVPVQKQITAVKIGGAVPTMTETELKNIDLVLPQNYDERIKIGEYFQNLDNLITLHQRKCDETKELKKYMLQKMFPQNGESKPEIRFAGFTDDWEQRKFGEMFKRRMERNGNQFDNTRWISVAKMYFQDPDKVTSNNIDTRTYVMRIGDIAFEGHSNNEFKYGRFVENNIGDGVVSELFPIYQHIDEYDLGYWKYAIQLESIMQSKLVRCIEISYTSSNKLDEASFLKESILVPSIEEQEQIGTFFTNLDNLITLHQRKCDEMKEIKKYMLQNMFPQKG